MGMKNCQHFPLPRDDRPGRCTRKCLTVHSMYVQINRQEPLWNETMLLSQTWTEMLYGLQRVPWTIMQQQGHDHEIRR